MYRYLFFWVGDAVRQAGVYRSRLSEFERRYNSAFGLRIPGVGGGKIRNFIILRVFILLRADSTLYIKPGVWPILLYSDNSYTKCDMKILSTLLYG